MEMLSGDMAREQIQDRVRVAAQDRKAAAVRRVPSRKFGSGLSATFSSLRLWPRSSEEAPARVARVARTAV
jgi:hypothetical protein